MSKIKEVKMLKTNHKFVSGVSENALLTPVGQGVYLKSLGEKAKSGYAHYYFLHPDEKKGDLSKPIPADVIDFIVESFQVEPEKYENEYKRKLKKGLMMLNKKSKTARKLIVQLYHNQQIEINEGKAGEGEAYIIHGQQKIYIRKDVFEGGSILYNAICLLHETGHEVEQEHLMPLGSSETVYCDQHGRPIYDFSRKIRADDKFRLSRVHEAEKLALEENIFAEYYSFGKTLLILGRIFFGRIPLYGSTTVVDFIRRFIPVKSQRFRYLEDRHQIQGVGTKAKRIKAFFNLALRSPGSLFLKQKREELKEKAFNLVMAHRINELILPQEKKESVLKRNECHYKKQMRMAKKLLTRIGVLTGVGVLLGLGVAPLVKQLASAPLFLYPSVKFLAVSCFFSVAADCVYNGMVYAKRLIKDSLINPVIDTLQHVRDSWCVVYNEQANDHISSLASFRRNSKKKVDLVIETYCHKYGGEVQPNDIKKSRTDQGEIEKENRQKRLITALDKKMERDLFHLADILCVSQKEEEPTLNLTYYYRDKLLLAGRRLYLKNKKQKPFQKVFTEYILNEINQGKLFQNVMNDKALDLIEKLTHPAIKKALLRKVFYQRQDKFKQHRQAFFNFQKKYFDVLLG